MGSERYEEGVYMMGRRLEMGSGGPMKLDNGLDVWRRRRQAERRASVMRVDILAVA